LSRGADAAELNCCALGQQGEAAILATGRLFFVFAQPSPRQLIFISKKSSLKKVPPNQIQPLFTTFKYYKLVSNNYPEFWTIRTFMRNLTTNSSLHIFLTLTKDHIRR